MGIPLTVAANRFLPLEDRTEWQNLMTRFDLDFTEKVVQPLKYQLMSYNAEKINGAKRTIIPANNWIFSYIVLNLREILGSIFG